MRALPRKKSGRPGSSSRRDTRAALLFISPWIAGFLIFTLWPVSYSAYLSLTDYDVLNDPRFIGLANYQQMISDPKVSLALWNTVFFTVFSVPLHIVASLGLALLLNRAGRAAGFFRTAFYLPNMTPPVAVGVLVLLLLNGQNGLINTVLGWIGIRGPDWTTDPHWVKPGLILMSLWTLGASVIIFLAALRAVPPELEEAAKLDGANAWQRTLRIKIPLISGTIFFLTVVNTIGALQSFTEAYTAFFGSGSSAYGNDAALFYSIYLFQQAFTFLHMGYASAMAWLMFVIVMVITLVQIRLSRRFVYYEGARP